MIDLDAILLAMADDAFVVLNWARAQGFKKPQQLEQVVLAYKKSLTDNKVTLVQVGEAVRS